MSTEATLDFDALLAPISDEAPSGASLREHPELSRTYYSVRETRNMAMEAERVLARLALMEQSDFEREPAGGRDEARPVPNWAKVADMSSELLCQHSKDLWAVSWLIEAQTRLAGLAGFRDGLKLCRLLSERYWDSIHPRPDEEEGYAHTVAQLSGLDNSLSAPLQASPMLLSDDRITWTSYQYSIELDQMKPEHRAAKIEEGALSSQEFQQAIRTARREELLCTQADLTEAISELKLCSATLDRLCGKDASGMPLGPPTTKLQQTLERMLQVFQLITAGLLNETTVEQAGESALEAGAGAGQLTDIGGNPAPNGNLTQRPVASRDEALQHLLRVADYFRKAEPHSPVSYALEQAVRWGRMPLPELLKDLVNDKAVLKEVFERMGIPPADGSSD